MARTEDQPIFGRDVAEAVWRPTPDLLDGSRLARFLRTIGEPDIAAVQAHAVADPAWFWGAAVDDIEIAWQRRPTQVLDSSGGPEWTRWWRGGLLNYAAAAVEPRAARDPTAPAVTWEGEDGEVRTVTNAALLTAVADAAPLSGRPRRPRS